MKRWELAKQQGLKWQTILVQDCETDIKVIALDGARRKLPFAEVNRRVTAKINECVKELDTQELKTLAKNSLTTYASRMYLEWVFVYGDKDNADMILAAFLMSGQKVPDKVVKRLLALPIASDVKPYVGAYNRAVANGINPLDYEREVIKRVNGILDTVAKEDYSDRYSLRSGVEIRLRQEWHEKQLQGFKDSGVNLVWIDTHANCSERCEPYQGRLYSLDGTVGEIDGIKYVPLEVATNIYATTKAGKTYKNGCISGFNCRHKLIPYKRGFKPIAIPQSVIDKQREIDHNMRHLERTVRVYETRALGWKKTNNRVLYKRYKDLANKWTEKYVEYAKANNVAFYPSRLDI